MPGRNFTEALRKDYRAKKQEITRRLSEFKAVYEKGDEAIFEELCYCILTAGSSAKMGMRTVELLRDVLLTGDARELQRRAEKSRVRFWRVRPAYIVHTREYLKSICGLRLRKLIESFDDPEVRRDFFARNSNIKGLGYKESSHFLRNIGFRGYAILDKHIVNSLREMGVIGKGGPPATRTGYLEIEKRLVRFAREMEIDMDHLDLLLWSRKTGEILK
ncbi:MAG TPA: N-glycosylase/DNA lyase [Nitrospirota bacterium]|nr:N-glycosylase/DNA lyase [Nitrospirota bacterium]